jgi:DNA topoisomerase I
LDDAGRLQYIYSASFRAHQEREKFDRILRFAQALPRMRRVTGEHLKHSRLDQEKVLACIVRLMDRAYFRVGNEVYARENQSYGLTTIRSKHTKIRGDTIVFDFIGKSGQQQIKRIKDKKLARLLKQLDGLPGYEIFKYYDEDGSLKSVSSNDVNTYIKEIMGEEFSAKDFRTWGGTLLAAAELANAERAKNERERKKVVTQCVIRVAARLGNTPAIARSSYIDPRIINAYVDGDDLSSIRETVEHMDDKGALSADEHCVLRLLEKAA